MNEPSIEIRGLTVSYGRRRVLEGVDLAVPAGTTTVLLGENGAGKSTLLRALLGVVRVGAGRLRVAGLDPTRRPAAVQRAVGYVPDRPDAYPWMRVSDLFRFLRAHHAGWDAAHAASLVERLEVPEDVSLESMSRGQAMKTMLAAALAPKPSVLLLDEPFGGLDPLVREEVLRNVIGALGETAPTVLLATHDLEVAARVADRVAVLGKGRIREEGPADEIGRDVEPSPGAKRLHRALARVHERVP